MSRFRHIVFSLLPVVILIVSTGSYLQATDFTESDELEINKFRLSEQKLEQFAKATKNLVSALQKNPGLPSEFSRIRGEEESLASVIRSFDSITDAKKAVEQSGMTTRDYVLFQFATLYGASGHLILKAGGTLPSGYSKENVDFYRTHESEFMKLKPDFEVLEKLTDSDSDEDDEDEEDEEDEEEEVRLPHFYDFTFGSIN